MSDSDGGDYAAFSSDADYDALSDGSFDLGEVEPTVKAVSVTEWHRGREGWGWGGAGRGRARVPAREGARPPAAPPRPALPPPAPPPTCH